MQALIDNGSVVLDASNGLAYWLQDERLFNPTGFKVLQSQVGGFVDCMKVTYNGKIKLVYEVGPYVSLEALVPSLGPGRFQTIVANLLDALYNVHSVGFLHRCCTDTLPAHVFVDLDTFGVRLVNLPLNLQQDAQMETIFDRLLRFRILALLRTNPNLQGENYPALDAALLNETLPIASVRGVLQPSDSGALQPSVSMPTTAMDQLPPQPPAPAPEQKRGFFHRKEKKAPPQSTVLAEIQLQDEGGNNEQLDIFAPSLVLVGSDTPAKVEILIDKPAFLIGKKAGAADGVLDFNPAISRRHCQIVTESGRSYIEDLGSANGTYLNHKKLHPGKRHECKAGDSIKLANNRFTLRSL